MTPAIRLATDARDALARAPDSQFAAANLVRYVHETTRGTDPDTGEPLCKTYHMAFQVNPSAVDSPITMLQIKSLVAQPGRQVDIALAALLARVPEGRPLKGAALVVPPALEPHALRVRADGVVVVAWLADVCGGDDTCGYAIDGDPLVWHWRERPELCVRTDEQSTPEAAMDPTLELHLRMSGWASIDESAGTVARWRP